MFNNYIVRFFLRILIPAILGVALFAYNVRNSDDEEKKELFKFVLWAILAGFFASKISVTLTQIVRALVEPSSASHIFRYFLRTISGQSSFAAIFAAMYLLLTKKYKNIAYKYGNIFVPSVSLFLLFVYAYPYLTHMKYIRGISESHSLYKSIIIGQYLQILHIVFALTVLIISQLKIKTASPGKVLNIYMLAYFLLEILNNLYNVFAYFNKSYGSYFFVNICVCAFGLYLAYRSISGKEPVYNDLENQKGEGCIMNNEDSDAKQNPHKGRKFLVGFLLSSISLPIAAWTLIAFSAVNVIFLSIFILFLLLICLFSGRCLLKKDTKNIWYINGFIVGFLGAALIFLGSCIAIVVNLDLF